MKKNYQCHFDFDEVSGGAIITEYDEEDAPMVSVAEYGNIEIALGNILYSEINEGAGLSKARVTIIIEEL
jgi:hypothetical protein